MVAEKLASPDTELPDLAALPCVGSLLFEDELLPENASNKQDDAMIEANNFKCFIIKFN